MPKNSPRPICPKCGKPMHFVIIKTGGRKFRCIKCDDIDPMQVPDFHAWTKSELLPPKTK
jgi:ssDNA-binding Zn-finger/Zn-ribbon topoisomerase 1